ncbi:MAG: DUF5711 family protein [Clostridium sp.]|nr:DUF5711 family protein [Clostridium sp.]
MKDKKRNKTDNVVYMGGSEEALKNNKEAAYRARKQKSIKMTVLLLAIVIAAVSAIVLLNREYHSYKVQERNETQYENTAGYVQFCGNLLKYTPDGVSYIDANGNVVWTAGVNMKMPMAVTSGSYAAVADMSGNEVYIFSEEGQVSSLTMPYTICDVDVANQGAFAVVLESEKTNYVNIYDKNGDSIHEMQTTIGKSGYPLDITISNDGRKLFTSYINVNSGTVQNNLAAYNLGDVGQNANADRMVGGYKLDGQIVPKVQFISNDTLAAFGTSSIKIYSMKEKPNEKAEIDFEGEIRSVFYNEDYIGFVQEEKSDDGESGYVMRVYDTRGNKKFTETIDFNYDNIYAAEKEIIVTGDVNCKIIRTSGSIKFDGMLSGKILSMVPSGKKLSYVVVYDDATEIIKLKSDKSSENE